MSADLHLPIPQDPHFLDVAGILASLLPVPPPLPAQGWSLQAWAGLQVLGLGEVLSSWCLKQGGTPSPFLLKAGACFLSSLSQHPGQGRGQVMEEVEKGEEHLECGCKRGTGNHR